MIYDFLFLIFSIFYLPTLIFKGRLHKDFLERFGIFSESKRDDLDGSFKNVIWIQAVSVGEVALCRSLIPELRKRYPESGIVFSTITRAGNELARKLFFKDARIIYFPLDFSFIANRVVRFIRPALYIMIETEIWPNVIYNVWRSGGKIVMLNGRISDRSVGKYMFVRPFLKKTLGMIDLFCMQSDTDADRIIAMGAPDVKVKVTGNMKFDIDLPTSEKTDHSSAGIFGLSAGDDIFVAGSTHGGEEEMLLRVYKSILKDLPRLKFIIAPRHVERSDEICRIARNFGFKAIRFSGKSVPGLSGDESPGSVYILDEIGRLKDAYQIAGLVFIGGSMVRHGGQNPIEPAVFSKCVIFGPYMFNFNFIASVLLKNNAAIQVDSEALLLLKARELLLNKEAALKIGRAGKKVIEDNRGALRRNIDLVEAVIK